jgi:hypothetical protein
MSNARQLALVASGIFPMVQGEASGLKNVAASPISLTGTTATSTSITAASVTAGYVANGAYITGSGVSAGTYITALAGTTITTSAATTASASGVALTIFPLNTRITTANALVVADATGNAKMLMNVNVTASINSAGAGGLDTGAVAASTWYYEYVIWGQSTGAAKVFSLSATAPTLPTGYTMYAWVGAVKTDANKILLYTIKLGRKNRYVVATGSNVPNLPLVASGTAGSISTPTFVAVSVLGYAPPLACAVSGVLANTGVNASSYLIAPNASYGAQASTSNACPYSGALYTATYGGIYSQTFELWLESTSIYWASGIASNYLYLSGWEDNQ